MSDSFVPSEYNNVMPYLILPGALPFFDFCAKVFDGKEKMRMKNDDGRLIHGEILIGSSVIMFADASEQFPQQTAGMFIYCENADETFAKAIEEGATIEMELSDQPYGRTCGIKDPFGNTWWITSVAA